MERHITEFRKTLRYAYRNSALNMFGADWKELTLPKIKAVLDCIIKDYYPLRPYPPGSYDPISKDEFLTIFRDVFKNEIKKIKGRI